MAAHADEAWASQDTLLFSCSIMSAIDMFATLDVIEGKQGEKRVCISLNG
jgi:cyanate lyase